MIENGKQKRSKFTNIWKPTLHKPPGPVKDSEISFTYRNDNMTTDMMAQSQSNCSDQDIYVESTLQIITVPKF